MMNQTKELKDNWRKLTWEKIEPNQKNLGKNKQIINFKKKNYTCK